MSSDYIEEYRARERTLVDHHHDAAPPEPSRSSRRNRRHPRTWPLSTLLTWTLLGVVAGMITTLLLLPDDQPAVLDDPAAVAALQQAQQRIDALEAEVAARDAALADAQAALDAAGGGATIELPAGLDLPELSLPEVSLPETLMDEEAARSAVQRLIDRLQRIFGLEE